MKRLKKCVNNYFNPKNIYEANYNLIFILKIIGGLPLSLRQESIKNNKINFSRTRIYISRIVFVIYIILLLDQLYVRVAKKDIMNIQANILRADMVATFIAAFVNLSAINHFGLKCINVINKIFKMISEIDSKLPKHEVKKMNTFIKKVHLFVLNLIILNFASTFTYFCFLNFEIAGWRGIAKCFMYFYPFTNAYALIYCYICLVVMIRQRFHYLYNILKERYRKFSSFSKTEDTVILRYVAYGFLCLNLNYVALFFFKLFGEKF